MKFASISMVSAILLASINVVAAAGIRHSPRHKDNSVNLATEVAQLAASKTNDAGVANLATDVTADSNVDALATDKTAGADISNNVATDGAAADYDFTEFPTDGAEGEVTNLITDDLKINNPSAGRNLQGTGPDPYYPNYAISWDKAYCINTRPMPIGWPTYSSMLACCKVNYPNQLSGICLSKLPAPPTTAPTNSAREADFWYPKYERPFPDSGCSNKLPLPYNNINDRPNYETQLACCKAEYGGQMSGVCLAMSPSPTTPPPTPPPTLLLTSPQPTSMTCDTPRPLMAYKIPVNESGNDPRFPSMLFGFNQRWKAENASAVYIPRNPDEVAKAMDDVLHNYPNGLKVRSGGHCYENFVMNNNTRGIIDVGELTDWGHDESKGYYLSTGETTWSSFNKLFKRWGKMLPGGSCYSVGLGGHIAGGGYGIMSRKHGRTVDWLTGIEIVVKPNKHKPALPIYISEDSVGAAADLFWACKGAGGGNFGIITKYYFKRLPRAPRGAIISNLAFNWTDDLNATTLKDILDVFFDYGNRTDTRDSWAMFLMSHEQSGQMQMTLHTAYFNETAQQKAKLFHLKFHQDFDKIYNVSAPSSSFGAGHAGYWSRPVKNLHGRTAEDAIKDTTYDLPFYDATQTLNPSGANQRGKYKSAYMKQRFPLWQCRAIIDNLKTVPVGLDPADMKQSLLQIDWYGGRINDFAPESAAIPQRHTLINMQYQAYWINKTNDPLHLAWMKKFYHDDMYTNATLGLKGYPDPKALNGTMYEGCYYNYPDRDLNGIDNDTAYGGRNKALSLYFLDNYENNARNLVMVKKQWDYNDFFNHAQSIPVKH